MNKANVTVYPVDVNGLPLEQMWDASEPAGLYVHPELTHLSGELLPDHQGENRDGMKELAHRTGGKTCTAGNNLTVCLDQALTESSDYYLLGFYVSQQQRKAGWHKLKVSVSADHGEVRSRNTYFLRVLGPPHEQERQEDLLKRDLCADRLHRHPLHGRARQAGARRRHSIQSGRSGDQRPAAAGAGQA